MLVTDNTYYRAFTFVVDFAVPVPVGEFDHLFDVAVGQVLSEIKHGDLQLVLVDDSVAVDVKNAERLPHFFQLIGVVAVFTGAALHPVHVVLRPRHHT